MRQSVLCCLLVLGICGATNGQESRPASPAVIAPPEPTKVAGPDVVDHLRKAAEHLKAAGWKEHAEYYRGIADRTELRQRKELERQLAGKLSQLKQLQQEVGELRRRLGKVQQFAIQVRIVELDLKTLRDKSIRGLGSKRLLTHGLAAILEADSGGPPQSPAAVVKREKRIRDLIDSLRKQKVLKVLAEPQIITTDGRPAVYRSGGEFPVVIPAAAKETRIEWRDLGLKLELVPRLQSGGKLRVEIACQRVERNFRNTVRTAGGVIPGLTTWRINTQVETELERTVILGGMRAKSIDKDGRTSETERIVLITPKRIEQGE